MVPVTVAELGDDVEVIDERRRKTPLAGAVMAGASVVVLLVVAAWVVVYSGSGWDLTDEGYYLNLISHPTDYSATSTAGLFQYLWHPVYELTDGNIAVMRMLNVFLSMSLTFALAWTASSRPVANLVSAHRDDAGESAETSSRVVMAVAAAVSSLVVFDRWLVTPSYNSLNYQAIVLTMTCCLLVMSRPGRPPALGLAGIAAGGWLCLLAKPSSAALLGLVVAGILLSPSRWSLRSYAIIAGALALFGCTSLVAMGITPAELVDYYRDSLDLNKTLGGHDLSSLVTSDPLVYAPGMDTYLLYGAGLLIVACAVVLRWFPRLAQTVTVLSLVTAAAVTIVLFVGLERIEQLQRMPFTLVFWMTIPAAVLVLLVLGLGWLTGRISPNGLALLLIFFVLPVCVVLGTNNNNWYALSRVSAFWVLAMIVMYVVADARRRRALLPFFAVTMALAAYTVATSLMTPYRQSPVPLAHTSAVIGQGGAILDVHARTGEAIDGLRTILSTMPQEQPGVIDLTGEAPGLIFAAGGRALGQAWIIGGYSGSEAVAELALKGTRCADLERAAVLVSPDGPRRIPARVLAAVGLDLDRDYSMIGSVQPGVAPMQVFLPGPDLDGATHCRK